MDAVRDGARFVLRLLTGRLDVADLRDSVPTPATQQDPAAAA